MRSRWSSTNLKFLSTPSNVNFLSRNVILDLMLFNEVLKRRENTENLENLHFSLTCGYRSIDMAIKLISRVNFFLNIEKTMLTRLRSRFSQYQQLCMDQSKISRPLEYRKNFIEIRKHNEFIALLLGRWDHDSPLIFAHITPLICLLSWSFHLSFFQSSNWIKNKGKELLWNAEDGFPSHLSFPISGRVSFI